MKEQKNKGDNEEKLNTKYDKDASTKKMGEAKCTMVRLSFFWPFINHCEMNPDANYYFALLLCKLHRYREVVWHELETETLDIEDNE